MSLPPQSFHYMRRPRPVKIETCPPDREFCGIGGATSTTTIDNGGNSSILQHKWSFGVVASLVVIIVVLIIIVIWMVCGKEKEDNRAYEDKNTMTRINEANRSVGGMPHMAPPQHMHGMWQPMQPPYYAMAAQQMQMEPPIQQTHMKQQGAQPNVEQPQKIEEVEDEEDTKEDTKVSPPKTKVDSRNPIIEAIIHPEVINDLDG